MFDIKVFRVRNWSHISFKCKKACFGSKTYFICFINALSQSIWTYAVLVISAFDKHLILMNKSVEMQRVINYVTSIMDHSCITDWLTRDLSNARSVCVACTRWVYCRRQYSWVGPVTSFIRTHRVSLMSCNLLPFVRQASLLYPTSLMCVVHRNYGPSPA